MQFYGVGDVTWARLHACEARPGILSAVSAGVELSILSAMAHGNGPRGLAVLEAAFGALGRLDEEHAAVYFQIIWDICVSP